MTNDLNLLLDNESVFTDLFQNVEITDQRDVLKFKQRKRNKCVQPRMGELFSCNHNFNGKYNSCRCGKCNDL